MANQHPCGEPSTRLLNYPAVFINWVALMELMKSDFKYRIVLHKSPFPLGFRSDSELTHKRRDARNAVSRTHIPLPICVGI